MPYEGKHALMAFLGAACALERHYNILQTLSRKINRLAAVGNVNGVLWKAKIAALFRNVITRLLPEPESSRAFSFIKVLLKTSCNIFELVEDIKQVMFSTVDLGCNDPYMLLIMEHCVLRKPIPVWLAIPYRKRKMVEKVGEGGFGEVYKCRDETGSITMYKFLHVLPTPQILENVNRQLSTKEIYGEVIAAKELSTLRDGNEFSSPSFIKTKAFYYTRGVLPQNIIAAWKLYNRNSPSEYMDPEEYSQTKMTVVLEMEYGGEPLRPHMVTNANTALSIINQIALSLCVGEQCFQFEHRDLHINNILLTPCPEELKLIYKIKNIRADFSSCGWIVSIIDFSISRLETADGRIVCTEMGGSEYFRSEGGSLPDNTWFDNRYINLKMAEATNNDWTHYHPRTNVLWLKHIVEIVTHVLIVRDDNGAYFSSMQKLEDYKNCLLNYESATSFSMEKLCHRERLY